MSQERRINYFEGVLFKPSRNRTFTDRSTGRVERLSLGDSFQKEDFLNQELSSSFRYDQLGNAIKSTQQLNIDWSRFELHTFFNSAKAKTHVAIDKILNRYPFDGTYNDHIKFIDSLEGFEKYVFDKMPKNVGILRFDRKYGNGNFISVNPRRGTVNTKDDSEEKSGNDFLKIGSGPLTIELSIFIPSGSINDNEVIVQRLNSSNTGFTAAVSSSKFSSSPKGKAPIFFGVSSGSLGTSLKTELEKGKFHFVSLVFDRGNSDRLIFYKDGEKVTESSSQLFLDSISSSDKNLTIGSGSVHSVGNEQFSPIQNLSGAIDEFRYFSQARSKSNIKKYYSRPIFSEKDLKLYFKFNEPSGSYDLISGNPSLVLDYSGNSLHSSVQNFNIIHRNSLNILTSSLRNNSDRFEPILFPSFKKVSDFASELILSASEYDNNNPNLITNLIPRHYLEESSNETYISLEDQDSKIYSFDIDAPTKAKMPQSQIISQILFMWASAFDEMKIFIDEFSRLLSVEYDKTSTVSDQMLPFLAKYFGLELPKLFNKSNESQFLDGQNIFKSGNVSSALTLKQIQCQIWRRILTEMPHIRKKRGTIDSIKSIFRSMGINPDAPYRIKEYGGSKNNRIVNSFEKRKKNLGYINFSGNYASGSLRGDGINTAVPLFRSSFLSASRVEPGAPKISGTFVKGKSNASRDGLFTSGSWTVEGMYSMTPAKTELTHSLMRIQTTGSRPDAKANNFVIFNLLATNDFSRNGSKGKVTLLGKPAGRAAAPILNLSLDLNIFDGNQWQISFGRTRNDMTGSVLSSSYHLRAGTTSGGTFKFYKTSSFYDDSGNNTLNTINSVNNASGAFIAVGSMSLGYDRAGSLSHLNDHSNLARVNSFTGSLGPVRFYTIGLEESTSRVHSKNPFSLGVKDPKVNFSFTKGEQGSFQSQKVNLQINQLDRKTDLSGNLKIFDFSQNEFHGQLTGFPDLKQVIFPKRIDYEILTPKFETGAADQKIRVRSYNSTRKALAENVFTAPLYDFPPSEVPQDDRRVGVEISIAQALNDDIANIISSLDFFNNAIGDPELVFSQEYRDLRNMRDVYFNRLEKKMSVKKFFEFYRWFDDVVGDIIEDMIPSTSKYLGTNFVIESHMLERAKMVYNYQDMYVGELDRLETSSIFLQQFFINVRKS